MSFEQFKCQYCSKEYKKLGNLRNHRNKCILKPSELEYKKFFNRIKLCSSMHDTLDEWISFVNGEIEKFKIDLEHKILRKIISIYFECIGWNDDFIESWKQYHLVGTWDNKKCKIEFDDQINSGVIYIDDGKIFKLEETDEVEYVLNEIYEVLYVN